MKKKILLLIMLLVPFLVNAKEEINYGWDKENSNGIILMKEENNQYLVIDGTNNGPRITYYQPNGKKVSSRYIEKESTEYYTLYEEVESRIPFTNYYYRYEDGVYYELEPQRGYIYVASDDSDEGVEYYYDELSESDKIKYTGKYHLIFELYSKIGYESSYYYAMVPKSNGYVVYKKALERSINSSYTLEVYDKDENKVLTKRADLVNDVYNADITEYGIYLIESTYDHEAAEATYTFITYNLSGKEQSRTDITDALNESTLSGDLYYYLPITMDIVNNGMVIGFTEDYYTDEIQSCINYYTNPKKTSDEEFRPDNIYDYCSNEIFDKASASHQMFKLVGNGMTSLATTNMNVFAVTVAPAVEPEIGAGLTELRMPYPVALVKLNIDYAIDTKISGKGDIKVVSRSEAGNGVTFEVIPKEGYVLGEVKVTDMNGNVVTFKDYTFTMPSSDVLIEVTFLPKNPLTVDKLFLLIPILVLGGLLAAAMYKKVSWLR
mgnify:CR=1 FL=1